MDTDHYNQKPRRRIEFINLPNVLKAKIGSGGLNEKILDHAQQLLENHSEDFLPLAEIYLMRMEQAINVAQSKKIDAKDLEDIITDILLPCVQLKANGSMFNYPLVTRIAGRFAQFMEVVDGLDKEVLKIANAFHSTIKIVVAGRIKGNGGVQGDALVEELNNACERYFQKYNGT